MNITVLAGGNSTERDVSLISGKGVYEALKKSGHKVVLIDVYLGVEDVDVANVFEDPRDWSEGISKISENNPDLEALKQKKGADKSFFGKNVLEICMASDICFLALHGANGEDGRVQAALDLYGVKYTGTDYLSSAICMDKTITKKFLLMNNIRTPLSVTVEKGEDYSDKISSLEYPMVVKAPNGGSSIGVYIVHNREELDEAVKECLKLDDKLLFEEFIKGREVTCGVLDGKALPIVEIEPVKGFYDYKNKYQEGSTIETCPANLPEDITALVQNRAEAAFKAFGLQTYARIDFIIDESGEAYCLEANTLPGMTPTSLIPQEANVIGMDYLALCNKIIELSLKKYEVK